MHVQVCHQSRYSLPLLAAIISTVGCYVILGYGMSLHAQTSAAPTQRIDVLTQALSDIPGREVRILVLDLMPGHASPPHRHPGHHVFGYIAEGTYEWKIDDQPMKTFGPGESFYEPPGVVHEVSRNPSTTSRTKLVVFIVAKEDQPTTVAEPEHK